MCCRRISPCVLVIVMVLSFFASGLTVNYYVSYGPLNINQQKTYFLAFLGQGVIIVTGLLSICVLNSQKREFIMVFLCNSGFVTSGILLLISTIMFYKNPATVANMKTYALHKFLTTNESTRILERLQKHSYEEKGTLECCGVESYLDYTAVNIDYQNLSVTEVHVPDSCCIRMKKGCGRNLEYPRPPSINDTKIYHKGCLLGGIDAFINRQDYFTHAFYYKSPYTLGILFCAVLLSMLSFNCLYMNEGARAGLERIESLETMEAGPRLNSLEHEYGYHGGGHAAGGTGGAGEFVTSPRIGGSLDRFITPSGSADNVIVPIKHNPFPIGGKI